MTELEQWTALARRLKAANCRHVRLRVVEAGSVWAEVEGPEADIFIPVDEFMGLFRRVAELEEWVKVEDEQRQAREGG